MPQAILIELALPLRLPLSRNVQVTTKISLTDIYALLFALNYQWTLIVILLN